MSKCLFESICVSFSILSVSLSVLSTSMFLDLSFITTKRHNNGKRPKKRCITSLSFIRTFVFVYSLHQRETKTSFRCQVNKFLASLLYSRKFFLFFHTPFSCLLNNTHNDKHDREWSKRLPKRHITGRTTNEHELHRNGRASSESFISCCRPCWCCVTYRYVNDID